MCFISISTNVPKYTTGRQLFHQLGSKTSVVYYKQRIILCFTFTIFDKHAILM